MHNRKMLELFDTKLKGDYAESLVISEGLKRGWGVLKPVGDRLPYDLVFDINGRFIKIQVKYAWFNAEQEAYNVSVIRTKTNRRVMLKEKYKDTDFDFAIAVLPNSFYVLPIKFFNSFKGSISFVETDKRQRKPRSAEYKEAWNLIYAG